MTGKIFAYRGRRAGRWMPLSVLLALLISMSMFSGCVTEVPDHESKRDKLRALMELEGTDKDQVGALPTCTGENSSTKEKSKGWAIPTYDGPEVELILWHAYRAEEKKAINQVVDKFNAEHPNIKVKPRGIPYDAYPDKITNAIPRGRGPDVFIFAHDRIGDWAETELIEPLNFWVTPESLDIYLENTVDALIYKNLLYGLPLAFKSFVLFYNTDLIKTPPKTDTEMLEMAKRHTNVAEKRYGLAYENTLLYAQAMWFHGYGGGILEKDGTVLLDSPENTKALQYAADLVNKYEVCPVDVAAYILAGLFNEGKAAMVVSGPWFRGDITDKVNYSVAPLPIIEETGLPMKPYLGSEGVMMSKLSKNKDASLVLMFYLVSQEAAVIRYKVGQQPVANKAIYDLDEVKNDKMLSVFRQQVDATVPMPNIPKMRVVWTPANDAIYGAIKGKKDPAQLLNEAEVKIESDWKH